tara:strand:+ start:564 stop:1205 length:642 start_codon:yes stop_codon:yes gene_type:complete
MDVEINLKQYPWSDPPIEGANLKQKLSFFHKMMSQIIMHKEHSIELTDAFNEALIKTSCTLLSRHSKVVHSLSLDNHLVQVSSLDEVISYRNAEYLGSQIIIESEVYKIPPRNVNLQNMAYFMVRKIVAATNDKFDDGYLSKHDLMVKLAMQSAKSYTFPEQNIEVAKHLLIFARADNVIQVLHDLSLQKNISFTFEQMLSLLTHNILTFFDD